METATASPSVMVSRRGTALNLITCLQDVCFYWFLAEALFEMCMISSWQARNVLIASFIRDFILKNNSFNFT